MGSLSLAVWHVLTLTLTLTLTVRMHAGASVRAGTGLDTSRPDGAAALPWAPGDMAITYTLEGGATLTLRASGERPPAYTCGGPAVRR